MYLSLSLFLFLALVYFYFNLPFIQRFLNPLTSASTSPKPIIKPDQVKTVSCLSRSLTRTSSSIPSLVLEQLTMTPTKLFSICDVICNYHVMFLEGLERRLMKWKTGASEQLGDYFSQVVCGFVKILLCYYCPLFPTNAATQDFLTIYSEYINNYNDSLAIYNELRKKTVFINLLQVYLLLLPLSSILSLPSDQFILI